MSHGDRVERLPEGFKSIARSENSVFAAIKNGTTDISLYIDGKIRAINASTGADSSLNDPETRLYIGIDTDASSNPWAGDLDNIKIQSGALTASQLYADIANGAAVFGSESSDPLSDGLVGYWKMDDAGVDAEGETSTDSSGNGNTGTLYGDNGVGDNGTGLDCTASAKFGSGCNLDGTDDYISVASHSSFQITGDLTMSAWFNATNVSTDANIINLQTSGGAIRY